MTTTSEPRAIETGDLWSRIRIPVRRTIDSIARSMCASAGIEPDEIRGVRHSRVAYVHHDFRFNVVRELMKQQYPNRFKIARWFRVHESTLRGWLLEIEREDDEK